MSPIHPVLSYPFPALLLLRKIGVDGVVSSSNGGGGRDGGGRGGGDGGGGGGGRGGSGSGDTGGVDIDRVSVGGIGDLNGVHEVHRSRGCVLTVTLFCHIPSHSQNNGDADTYHNLLDPGRCSLFLLTCEQVASATTVQRMQCRRHIAIYVYCSH